MGFDRDAGLISGTPTQPGSWTFTLRLVNDFDFDEQELTITITAPPAGGGGTPGGGTTGGTTGTPGASAGVSPASGDQVLPNVGADASVWAALTGVLFLVLGVVMMTRVRRPLGTT